MDYDRKILSIMKTKTSTKKNPLRFCNTFMSNRFVLFFGYFLFIQTINAQNTMLYNPFHIAIDPMERLLLVNFEKHPDSLYIGVSRKRTSYSTMDKEMEN